MRETKQKNLIMSIISNSYTHPTANEVYEECKKTIADISLGTVYRNLNLLACQGQIRRIKMPNNIDRFDRYSDHTHFICGICGKIFDVPGGYVKNIIDIDGHKVMDYELNFRGVCQNCLEKEGEI